LNKKPTYGEVVETLTALLAMLGTVLCLQVGFLNQVVIGGYSSGTGSEQVCCVQITDVDHQHTDAKDEHEPVPGAVDLPHFSLKFYAALASDQPQPLQPCLLLQYQAEPIGIGFSPTADRHILYRCLRI
jgi:hypothetical protein